MSQRYCRNCGAEMESGDRYCSECGHRTDAEDGESDQSGTEQGWGTGGDGWDEAGRQNDRPAGEYAGTGYDRGGQPDTTMAALTHVLALFTWLIGPLIVYLVTDDPFVEENAANAVDWQIMFTVYMILSFFLIFVLVGFVFLFVLPLLDMAFIVIAALKAGEGETWTYPLTPSLL